MTLNVIICLYFLFVIHNNNIFIQYTTPITLNYPFVPVHKALALQICQRCAQLV